MADPAVPETLRREVQVFGRYLVGRDPGPYVLTWYAAWHAAHGDAEAALALRIDRVLLALARRSRVAARVADTYGARFRPSGLLRRKLVLLVALVECSPETWQTVEEPGPGGRPRTLARLASRAALEGVVLVLAAILLLPVHGVLSVLPARPAAPGAAP